jgi:hypothetical protein
MLLKSMYGSLLGLSFLCLSAGAAAGDHYWNAEFGGLHADHASHSQVTKAHQVKEAAEHVSSEKHQNFRDYYHASENHVRKYVLDYVYDHTTRHEAHPNVYAETERSVR